MYNLPPFVRWPHFMMGGPVGPGINYATAPTPNRPPPPPPMPGGAHGAGPTATPGIAGAQSFSNVPFQSGFQAQVPTSNIQFNPNQFMGGVGGAMGSADQLRALLMQQAQGGGPNPAALQERQATDRNIASAWAMGQANPNDPAAMYNIQNRVAAANQDAASQSALLTQQQQLASEGQLGQLSLGELGTAGGLMTDQQKMQLQQALANQSAGLTAQGQNLQQTLANQQIAAGLIQPGAALAGSVIGAGGAALANQGGGGQPVTADNTPGVTPAQPIPDTSGAGDFGTPSGVAAAHGGMIPPFVRRYEAGGFVSPGAADSLAAYDYETPSQVGDVSAPRPQATPGGLPISALAAPGASGGPAGQTAQGLGSLAGGVGGALAGTPLVGAALAAMPFVDPVVGNVTGWKPPTVQQVQQHGADAFTPGNGGFNIFDINSWFKSQGGPVPGHAQVDGDSEDNDTVPAMLSPGEVVLPRSVTQAEDAPGKAAAFMDAVRKSKAPKPTFKDVLASHRKLQERVGKLESLFSGGYA